MTLPVTTLETVDHLDWEHVPPCEHSQHTDCHPDEPAAYLVAGLCPSCSNRILYLICAPGWDLLKVGLLHCMVCDDLSARDDALWVVRVIGGRA